MVRASSILGSADAVDSQAIMFAEEMEPLDDLGADTPLCCRLCCPRIAFSSSDRLLRSSELAHDWLVTLETVPPMISVRFKVRFEVVRMLEVRTEKRAEQEGPSKTLLSHCQHVAAGREAHRNVHMAE